MPSSGRGAILAAPGGPVGSQSVDPTLSSAAEARPMRQLTHLRDGRKTAEYLLDLSAVIIGRGQSATLRLDDNRQVSRQHAVIRLDSKSGEYVLEDIGGANGTFVNGQQVESYLLRPGDHIVLGRDTLRFDFATRLAISLKDRVAEGELETHGHNAISDEAVLQSISEDNVDPVNSLAAVREERLEHRPETPAAGSEVRYEHTTVAGEDEVKRQLAEMMLKAEPHVVLRIDGKEELIALKNPPVLVGHTAACAIRLPGRRFFGKIAASLVQQSGGWCLVPESPFWSPVLLDDQKIERIRRLEAGDWLYLRGAELVYSSGEDR